MEEKEKKYLSYDGLKRVIYNIIKLSNNNNGNSSPDNGNGDTIQVSIAGATGNFTFTIAGSVDFANATYEVDGTTLICGSDVVEDTTLILAGGELDGNVLIL